MNEDIRKLEPTALWNYFCDINAIPRPSKKEEKIIAFIKKFGESLGLPTRVDEAGNVIISKPATQGYENRQPIVLQSHLDMVHQKNSDTSFDFATQGIEMYLAEEDWVKAKGTTLGADNGIGVAAILSLLSAQDIPHPAFEALFTIDEETGMTGALSLQPNVLHGHILLNLDTEDDDELTIGCAGGIDVTATGNYREVELKSGKSFQLFVKGLTGGHSGVDIHLGRANANKIMNRILWEVSQQINIRIHRIDGGSLRNAIPRESTAVLVVEAELEKSLRNKIEQITKTIQDENRTTDPNIQIEMKETDAVSHGMSEDFQKNILNSLYACPNGIYRMSAEMEGLVQTSNNLAKVSIGQGSFSIQCLTRSSNDTEKMDLAQSIEACFALSGADTEFSSGYPGWKPKPDSEIVQLMQKEYKNLFNKEAHVHAIHAGLECGIIGTHYPDMQMISFGPNIYGAHSPDERVQISSVQKFWKYLLAVLKQIPEKQS